MYTQTDTHTQKKTYFFQLGITLVGQYNIQGETPRRRHVRKKQNKKRKYAVSLYTKASKTILN